MNFNLQMNNIFNQRRGELMENQRRRDVAVQQELNNAYNELQQLAHDNDIPLDINVEVGGEIPAGLAFPINVIQAATQFYLNILNIFVQRGRELPPLDAGGAGGWQAMYIAHNRLVLELGHNNGLGIEVTVLNMNDQHVEGVELDGVVLAQWQALAAGQAAAAAAVAGLPVGNNNMPHLIPAADMDEMPALIEDDNADVQENLPHDGVQPAFGWGAYPEEAVPEGDGASESDDSDSEDDNDGPLPAMVRAAPAVEDDPGGYFAAELAFRAAENNNDVDDDPMDDLDNDFNDCNLHQYYP